MWVSVNWTSHLREVGQLALLVGLFKSSAQIWQVSGGRRRRRRRCCPNQACRALGLNCREKTTHTHSPDLNNCDTRGNKSSAFTASGFALTFYPRHPVPRPRGAKVEGFGFFFIRSKKATQLNTHKTLTIIISQVFLNHTCIEAGVIILAVTHIHKQFLKGI